MNKRSKMIKTGLAIAFGLALLAAPAAAHDTEARAPVNEPEARRAVDLAICLDASGSMNGLIDAARQKLWAIVNDLALAKPTPDLRVGLLTFGNDKHLEENGWVLRQTDLTTDLDLVSERLFGITTDGGTEYVGRVVKGAMEQLTWSKDPQALQLIIVAGNESADQDQQVSFRDACKLAIGKGVMVNSIYCGSPTDPLAKDWQSVATLADGHYATIDKDQGTVVVSTPFDATMTELSATLNKTYLPFGELGAWSCKNQQEQDGNANLQNDSTGASRAQSKAGANYRNDHWDLVDASKKKDFKLADVEEKDLPEAMRKMTLEERKAHITKMGSERERISKEINELGKKRRAFIDEAMKKSATSEDLAFDFAVRKAIREQARVKGFTFVEE